MDGHEDDIFSCAFNYSGDTIITGSKDNTYRICRDELGTKPKDREDHVHIRDSNPRPKMSNTPVESIWRVSSIFNFLHHRFGDFESQKF